MSLKTVIMAMVALLMAACGRNADVPVISVGIMMTDSLTVTERDAAGQAVTQYHLAVQQVDSPVTIVPAVKGGVLEVADVTIGVGFHWQQKEPQQFEGVLRVVNVDGRLLVINDIDIERYLESVISSEMSANSSPELLRAHAIVSRSWLLSQLSRSHSRETRVEKPGEVVVWYDRDDHALFDVCADDHCQRYQGVTRRSTPRVAEAVKATRGLVLMYDREVCDARFSKCCGGVTERFENCWEPVEHPYLAVVRDGADSLTCPVLVDEQAATEWIESRPDGFCANPSTEILAAVLNSYDRATADYYRWNVCYSADSLGRIVAERSGRDLGYITGLEALERGSSGRIYRLRITGSKGSMVVGKELEIRRVLSTSHLYSSAFTTDFEGDGPGARITFRGAGWGHGVGMCQIGAAVMGATGYSAEDILSHYFRGATLECIY